MSALNYIEPDTFIGKMREHWTGTLENVSSSALEIAWKQLAQAFKQNIVTHNNPDQRDEWIVCQPPTGSGKTQGTVLYSAMLAQVEEHPGVLIVTRLIEEADILAEQVNQFAGQQVAVAHHSESKTSFEELSSWPVLVITHRAYELALDYLGQDGTIQKTFDFFHNFESFDEKRKMVVIDECLDIVEHHQIQPGEISRVIQAIDKLDEKFPKEAESLKRMAQQSATHDVIWKINRSAIGREQMIHPDLHNLNFGKLREAIWKKDIKWDVELLGKSRLDVRKDAQRHIDNVLKALEQITKETIYLTNYNGSLTWNSAKLLVPDEVKGAVVLDATASVNSVYKLFDKAVIWSPPEGVRNYKNVTLHVSTGHKVGKQSMVENAKEEAVKVEGFLSDLFKADCDRHQALVVTHKDVEPVLINKVDPEKVVVGHWGAVQGRNKWKDCDTIMMWGLPYKPDFCTMNVYQVLQGPLSPTVADLETKAEMSQARRDLKMGWVMTDILQAFNRIRCRKTIDAEGNCPKAEGYILFKSKDEAEEVLEVIEREMPGINIDRSWEFNGGTVKRRNRKSNAEAALISYLDTMDRGRWSKSDVQEYLGISQAKMTQIVAQAKDSESTVGQAMNKAGVALIQGKGKTTYFDKP